jgi:hypothetical protein
VEHLLALLEDDAPRSERPARLFLVLHGPDEQFAAVISESVAHPPRAILRVDVHPEAVAGDVLGVEIHDRAGCLVVRGCVALRVGLGGRKTGEAMLKPLCLPVEQRMAASLAPFYLTLDPSLVRPEEDAGLAERSLQATTDPKAREILRRAWGSP